MIKNQEDVVDEDRKEEKKGVEPEVSTAVALEKNLLPVKQNLAEVRVDLEFNEEDLDLDPENKSSNTSEQDGLNDGAVEEDVEEHSSSTGGSGEDEDNSAVSIAGRKRKSVEELDGKIEKYRKFLKNDMRKRQDAVFNFNPEPAAPLKNSKSKEGKKKKIRSGKF